MKISRIVSWFPVFLMAVVAIVVYWLIHLLGELVDRPATLAHEPDYIVYGFNVRHFDDTGFLSDTLYGQMITHYPDSATSKLSDPIVLHRSSLTEPTYRASAQSGVLEETTRRVTLSGGVRITRQPVSGATTTLYTEIIRYHDKTGIAETDHPVDVVFGRSRFKAQRLRLDVRKDQFFLDGNVTGAYHRDG